MKKRYIGELKGMMEAKEKDFDFSKFTEMKSLLTIFVLKLKKEEQKILET